MDIEPRARRVRTYYWPPTVGSAIRDSYLSGNAYAGRSGVIDPGVLPSDAHVPERE